METSHVIELENSGFYNFNKGHSFCTVLFIIYSSGLISVNIMQSRRNQ